MLGGRCACNAVGYEVADEFVVAYKCHCSNCRAMTGSAFLPWGEIEPEELRVTRGADSLLVDGDAEGRTPDALRSVLVAPLLDCPPPRRHVVSRALRIAHR
jgi:hypothetical protein